MFPAKPSLDELVDVSDLESITDMLVIEIFIFIGFIDEEYQLADSVIQETGNHREALSVLFAVRQQVHDMNGDEFTKGTMPSEQFDEQRFQRD